MPQHFTARLSWILLVSLLNFIVKVKGPAWKMEKSKHFVMQCVEKNKLDKGLDFVIQPIFDLSRFICIGGEVLVRGTHRRHIVPPALFISELEKNGGIVSLGEYIMTQAFRYIADQMSDVCEKQIFTLNISWVQLQDVNFASRTLDLMDKYKLSHRHIVFEITDSIHLFDDVVNHNLVSLSDAGVCLAWDGINSLDKLQSRLGFYKPDYVKIDRSCLTSNNLEHTLAMLEYLKQWDVDVIIEGIENYTHVSTMLRHGVQYGQGFLFSRPISKEAFYQQYMRPEARQL